MKLNKKAIAGVGLGALALVGGTFAYYSQTASLDNPLKTGSHVESLVEEFTPPTEDQFLTPGQSWDKLVGAENTGDYPVLVRIKMEEKWNYTDETTAYQTIPSSNRDAFNKGKGEGNGFKEGIFTADQTSEMKEEDGKQVDIGDKNGKTEGDKTVVYKNLILTDDGWIDGEDGYWYWNGVLEAKPKDGTTNTKSKTSKLMDKLILATNVDLGLYETTEYYAKAADENSITTWTPLGNGDINVIAGTLSSNEKLFRKSESKLAAKKGYADSKYTLTITSEFVQATKDAVEDAWKAADGTPFNIAEKLNKVKCTDGINLTN